MISRKILVSLISIFCLNCLALPSFELYSPDFKGYEAMPEKSGCHSLGLSPALAWRNPPSATQSFALIVTDYDAQRVVGYPFEHWVVYGLSATARAISFGESQLLQGVNSSGEAAFYPFCPPDGLHHYTFVLYALDGGVHYPSHPSAAEVREAIHGHVLAEASLVGVFS